MAPRICGAFRTVLYDAAMVIAGMTPIYILSQERKELFKNPIANGADRPKTMETTLIKRQEDWENATKGRWTHRLIMNNKHG